MLDFAFQDAMLVLLIIDNGKKGLKKMQNKDALLTAIRNR